MSEYPRLWILNQPKNVTTEKFQDLVSSNNSTETKLQNENNLCTFRTTAEFTLSIPTN
jgi:hypothetical protein